MGHFMKARKLMNPGKKRKLSPLQKLYFGSKRQRAVVARKNPSWSNKRYRKALRTGQSARAGYLRSAAAKRIGKRDDYGFVTPSKKKNRVGNPSFRKMKKSFNKKYGKTSTMSVYTPLRKARKAGGVSKTGKRRSGTRIGNPSRIMTVSIPGLSNPGRKKGKSSMARKRYHRKAKVHNYKRRRNPARRVYHRRRRNPSVTYRRRHHRRVYHRRRNPSRAGVMGGVGKVGGMLAGAAVTHLVNGMLPASLTTGFLGYITTALVAVTQGKVVGSILRKPGLGAAMTTGGLFYLGLKVISDFVPSVGGYLPFSLKGMGIITPSSFYQPQVNLPGSMGSFVRPAMIPAAIPVAAGMRGIGGNAGFAPSRRTGRLR